MSIKSPGTAPTYSPSETSSLRIGIVHSRWNSPVITALLEGSISALTRSGVPRSNITIQSVPGSYELPYAVQKMYTASQTSSTTGALVSAATDLLSVASVTDSSKPSATSTDSSKADGEGAKGPFDVIIAIGVVIKGSTMHFEYICDAVSHGLMKVQIESGVPVIFGLLTCLTEEQAFTRAGIQTEAAKKKSAEGGEKLAHGESGHNHGEDWGVAAVEMGVKRRAWGEGKFVD